MMQQMTAQQQTVQHAWKLVSLRLEAMLFVLR
jgi:hypothetical protein